MKKLIIILVAVLAMFAGTSHAFASSVTTDAHVIGVGVYGDGSVWVTLDKNHDQWNCPGGSLEFAPTNVAAKLVLAEATAAISLGAHVKFQVDSCLNGAGTFSGVRSGAMFGITKP